RHLGRRDDPADGARRARDLRARPASGAAGVIAGPRLLAVGISHRTAPVSRREKASLAGAAARAALHSLRGWPEIAEALVLSTCSRTEVYVVTDDPVRAERALEA